MKISKNKTMSSLIALFLMLTIAALLVVLPTVNAAVTYYTSFIYIAASPNVIGVSQPTALVTWTAAIPPDIGEQTHLIPGDRAAWYDMRIEVTKPDNTTESFVIDKSDPVGGGYVTYTPTDVGTYYVQAFFLETWKNTTTNQAWYSAAESIKLPFTVQQEQIQPWPESPLPNDYWMRPINAASRDWSVLGGNWLGGAALQPAGAAGGTTANFVYGLGPESAHILWTRPHYAGGIMDERFGNIGYETAHYQGINLGSPIIIQGKLIVVNRDTAHNDRGWWVIDLYTGETLKFDNVTAIPAFGQIYNYESGNQHGGFPYLWRTSGVTISNPGGINGTVWEMLDGYTGITVAMIANVTSGGTAVYGKDGSILRYNLVNLGTTAAPNYYLQVWNSTAIPSLLAGDTGTNAWMWRPGTGGRGRLLGGVYVHDGSKGFSLNVSIPSVLAPRNAVLNETGSIRTVREGESVIVGTAGRNDERGVAKGWLMAFSLKPGQQGKWLWESTFTPPLASVASNVTVSMVGVYPEDGVILYEAKNTMKRWGYNMTTGDFLWENEPEVQINYYGMTENVYEGKLFSYGYGGQIRTYDIQTGEVLWTYDAVTVGFESAYGGNYPIGIFAIADGKLYTVSSEHSPTQPLYRGPNLRCINASDGTDIWKILFWGARMSPTEPNVYMADGILVGLNYFDMQLYAFGRGPSATTVSAPQTVPALGSSVTITGTVTDQTPTGRRNTNGIIEFTLKGTPAISDADMSAWMEYKFMQQAYPANAKGVEVTLTAIDPNNNYITIGTTTSDATGAYGFLWQPEVPGTYQIIATFAGSKSYGSSYAQTYMSVGEAPPEPAAPQPEPAQLPLDMYLLYATVAIIIAIGIVGFLILRKK